MNLAPYRKTVIAALTAAGAWATGAFADSHVTTQEWVALAVAIIGVLGVYGVPNDPAAGEPADPDLSTRGEISAVLLVILVVIAAIVLGIGVSHWFLLLLLLLLLVAVL